MSGQLGALPGGIATQVTRVRPLVEMDPSMSHVVIPRLEILLAELALERPGLVMDGVVMVLQDGFQLEGVAALIALERPFLGVDNALVEPQISVCFEALPAHLALEGLRIRVGDQQMLREPGPDRRDEIAHGALVGHVGHPLLPRLASWHQRAVHFEMLLQPRFVPELLLADVAFQGGFLRFRGLGRLRDALGVAHDVEASDVALQVDRELRFFLEASSAPVAQVLPDVLLR